MRKLEAYIKTEIQNGFDIQFGFFNAEGPGCADYRKGCVVFNNIFIYGRDTGYDENALIGVLYHEIGHLEYFKINPTSEDLFDEKYKSDSEYYAFDFSLKRLLFIAENGDIEPLKSSFLNINERIRKIKNNNLDHEESSHCKALELTSQSEIYMRCQDFIGIKFDKN